ncbi:MAG TPA: DUF885 family protein, partial [Sphingomonas sanguinis]|nr:DUF885 family protein [Sphingomonas sanguinis]
MQRRQFLASASLAAVTTAWPGLARAATGSRDAELRAMLDRFFYARLEDSPEQATSLGLDTGPRAHLKSRLGDVSRAGEARQYARARQERAALRTIPRASLGEAARLDYDIVGYGLDQVIAGERFAYGTSAGQYAPYVLSQLSGAYRDVPDFLSSQHQVANAADADAYVARVEAFAGAIDADTERQRQDAAKGVFAPDYILDTALKQLAAVRDKAPEATGPATDLAAKLKAANLPPERAQAVARLMVDKVFPALDRQRALVTELRGRAVHDAGVWRLPDGEA